MYSVNCGKCGIRIVASTPEELMRQVKEHDVVCGGGKGEVSVPRIEDLVPEEVLRGNIITMEDVLDRDILVKHMTFRNSAYQEDAQYLSLVVEIDGEDFILNTGAERIIQAFRHLRAEDLPVVVCFEKVKTAKGRRIYRIKTEG